MNQRQRPNWVCAEQSGGTTKKTAHNPTQLISGRLLPASTILIRFLARVLWPYVACKGQSPQQSHGGMNSPLQKDLSTLLSSSLS